MLHTQLPTVYLRSAWCGTCKRGSPLDLGHCGYPAQTPAFIGNVTQRQLLPMSADLAPWFPGAASKRRMLHQASRNIAGGFRGALGEPQSSSANGLPGSSHAPAAQAASSASAPRPFGGRTASRSLFGAPPAKAAVTPGETGSSNRPRTRLRLRSQHACGCVVLGLQSIRKR